jgi:hypothetical protein
VENKTLSIPWRSSGGEESYRATVERGSAEPELVASLSRHIDLQKTIKALIIIRNFHILITVSRGLLFVHGELSSSRPLEPIQTIL